MKRFFLTALCIVMAMGCAMAQKSFYDFVVKDQNGKDVKMSDYKGKYVLIVNTATQCGFTPQYKGLEKMYTKLKDNGLVILDFPCNQFGEQAPGSNEEIHNFCTENYHITFSQFDKVDVNGPNALPLFVWLKSQKGFQGFDLNNPIGKNLDDYFSKNDPNYRNSPDIKWNFTKFLVGPDGTVLERFEPTADTYTVMNSIIDWIFSPEKKQARQEK